jgi:hypothetical protein
MAEVTTLEVPEQLAEQFQEQIRDSFQGANEWFEGIAVDNGRGAPIPSERSFDWALGRARSLRELAAGADEVADRRYEGEPDALGEVVKQVLHRNAEGLMAVVEALELDLSALREHQENITWCVGALKELIEAGARFEESPALEAKDAIEAAAHRIAVEKEAAA